MHEKASEIYANQELAKEIAKELFGSNAKNQYKQLSMGGFRTEDLLWILNPSFTPDAFALDYTMNNFNFDKLKNINFSS